MMILAVIVGIGITLMMIGSILYHYYSDKVPEYEENLGDKVFGVGSKIMFIVIGLVLTVLPIISMFK